MKFDELLLALQKRKGTGDWRELAKRAGVSYDTLVRIARGDIPSPGIRTVEALSNALEAPAEPEQAAA